MQFRILGSLEIADASDLTDPRYAYMLHEVGEETRHQRAFMRLIEQIQPQADNPLDEPIPRWFARRASRLLMHQRALFCVMLLAGEEISNEEVYEHLNEQASVIIGDPDTCKKKMQKYKDIGVDRLMCFQQVGHLPHEQIMKSIRLVGEHLIPAFDRE